MRHSWRVLLTVRRLITDGEDRSSFFSADQLFNLLRNQNLKIFVIGLVKDLDAEGGLIRKSPRERAVKLLEQLAKETGGRAFFPQKAKDFERVVDEIAHDLQKQYVVGYRPVPEPVKNDCKIEIRIGEKQGKRKRRAILKPRYSTNELEEVSNN